MAAIPFWAWLPSPRKTIVLQNNKYGGECQITVVAVLFPAMSGLHSGFSPLKNSILVGFYSYFSGDQSGIIYHPFLLRYFGGGRCRYGKLLFTCLSHDLLVGLFFLQELWRLQQKYPFSTL